MRNRWGATVAALAVAATTAGLLGGTPAAATDGDTEAAATASTAPGRLMTVYPSSRDDDALGVFDLSMDGRVKLNQRRERILAGDYQQIDAAEVLTEGRGSAVLLLGGRPTPSGVEQTWAMLEHRGPVVPTVLGSGVFGRQYVSGTLLEHEGRGYVVLVGGEGRSGGDGYYSLMSVDARTGALRLASTGVLPGGLGWDVADLGGGEVLTLLSQQSGQGEETRLSGNSWQRWQIQGSGTSATLVRTAGAPLNGTYLGVERVETDGDPATREVVLEDQSFGKYSVLRFRQEGGPSLLGQGAWPYSQPLPAVHMLGNPEDGVAPLVVAVPFSPYARGLSVEGPATFRPRVASVAPMYDAAWVVDPTG